jgi:hypothetical protein
MANNIEVNSPCSYPTLSSIPIGGMFRYPLHQSEQNVYMRIAVPHLSLCAVMLKSGVVYTDLGPDKRVAPITSVTITS